MKFSRFQDLTNKKYNRLLAIKYITSDKYYNKIWLFRCDCGVEKEIVGTRVKTGRIKSCGCATIDNAIKQGKASAKPIGETAKDELLTDYKRDARKRNLEFSLTKEEFRKLISQKCHYCNEEPKTIKYDLFYNGVDRKNSNIGYAIENCLTSCIVCNRMKSNMIYEDFLNHIKKINIHIGVMV